VLSNFTDVACLQAGDFDARTKNRFCSGLIVLCCSHIMYTYLTTGCIVIRTDNIHAPKKMVKAWWSIG